MYMCAFQCMKSVDDGIARRDMQDVELQDAIMI